VEAHAAYYIDQALGGALAASREHYAQGLAALNSYAHMKMQGPDFVQLAPEQQDEVLRDLESDRATGFPQSLSPAAFFNLVRGHTLQGTFGDPIYGGNAQMVGWDLIGYPGVRLNVTASEQNMSSPAKPNHKSAYDYLMFSKTGTM
jgi:gluconate 2-dehydrogenase gamma chain